jgi:hypothetical protein
MKVLFSPDVQDFYYELEVVLLEKRYFSYKETADKYVADLFYDIQNNLPHIQHKPAPKHYEKYGDRLYYATFRKNRQTHWYAFFSKYVENGETVYLVCYLGNNHTEAHHLYISSLH